VGGQPRERGGQDIERGVPIPVQYQSAGRTDMGSHRKGFLHAIATPRAILRGEASRNGYYRDALHLPIGADPGEEQPPTGITDTLRQPVILDEVGDLQVFVGHQVARLDERPCRLRGKVLTLPTDLEIPFCETFHGLLAVL
jgi:hypothetical protein